MAAEWTTETVDLGSRGALKVFRHGAGPTTVLLHGGPGDGHGILRSLAELLPERECLLFDQRGSGDPAVVGTSQPTLDDLLADLEALRVALGGAPLTLIGHSWGAMLALIYAARHPASVAEAALIGMGPLSPMLEDVARANVRRPLIEIERQALATMKSMREEALAAEDWATYRAIIIDEVTQFSVRSWFFDPEVAARFAAEYREHYAFNPAAGRSIWASVDYEALWAALPAVTARLLVLYGYQDFEPITQGYVLRDVLPQVEIALINRCGHVPWLEQPAAVLEALHSFFERR